uniref:CCHC-type domain-containing protein n=1 Tax=Oryzias latipes TaxID=8090 RepID=A0A3P9KKF5_ORYLA
MHICRTCFKKYQEIRGYFLFATFIQTEIHTFVLFFMPIYITFKPLRYQKERVDAIIKGRGRLCQRCGSDHKPRQCPAFNDICHLCGYTGHWAKCCRNRKQQKKTEYTNQHWRDKSQPQSMGRYHKKSYQSQSYKNDRKKPNKGKIDNVCF